MPEVAGKRSPIKEEESEGQTGADQEAVRLQDLPGKVRRSGRSGTSRSRGAFAEEEAQMGNCLAKVRINIFYKEYTFRQDNIQYQRTRMHLRYEL